MKEEILSDPFNPGYIDHVFSAQKTSLFYKYGKKMKKQTNRSMKEKIVYNEGRNFIGPL
jgi:hypothetical protein